MFYYRTRAHTNMLYYKPTIDCNIVMRSYHQNLLWITCSSLCIQDHESKVIQIIIDKVFNLI